MEKLPMCRVCLAQNVRMYIVVNRNLHNLYEKLTDIPFVTEDSRPILTCFFCCTKLKQCYRFLRQCLEAEELFAQMMNEDYEPNHLIKHDHLKAFSGFIKSPIEHISIDDGCQTGSIAIKEELPAVCEELDDIIEPKEELQSDELEPETSDNRCLDAEDIHHSELDLEDDVPLIKFKTEVGEAQVSSKKKRLARKTKSATVAKKQKLDTRKTQLEDAITAEQAEKESLERTFSQKVNLAKHIRTHTVGKPVKPFKCDVCERIFCKKIHLTAHIRIHTGEKPFKCDVCQSRFSRKRYFLRHILIHTRENPFK